MPPVFKFSYQLFSAGLIPQRMETTGCALTTASVNCQRRWFSLRWSLIVRAVQAEAKMSLQTWPLQRAWRGTNWRTSGWEGKTKSCSYDSTPNSTWIISCQTVRCLSFISSHLRFLSSSSSRWGWTLCTSTSKGAVRYRPCCEHLRRGTATFWRTTCGGCPSGPASTCLSCSPSRSHKYTPWDASLMTPSGSAHSQNRTDLQLTDFWTWILSPLKVWH